MTELDVANIDDVGMEMGVLEFVFAVGDEPVELTPDQFARTSWVELLVRLVATDMISQDIFFVIRQNNQI